MNGLLDRQSLVANEAHLLRFFRDAYGEAYTGDHNFSKGYIALADFAVCVGEPTEPASAALLRCNRITASGTSTNREKYGSRFGLLVAQLAEVRNIVPQAWSTIGVSARPAVAAAAAESGMVRSHDRALTEERLSCFGDVNRYSIEESESGILIVLNSSNKGPDYWQEVWEFPQGSPAGTPTVEVLSSPN